MPRSQKNAPQIILPPQPDPDRLPRVGTADLLAQIATYYFGPHSSRTIRETWPLKWRKVNGRYVSDIPPFLAEAKRRFDAAPVIHGGRRGLAEQQAA
jgi:hypothetical protein